METREGRRVGYAHPDLGNRRAELEDAGFRLLRTPRLAPTACCALEPEAEVA
jgi:hypothetical protein